jgi:hypothetical protein
MILYFLFEFGMVVELFGIQLEEKFRLLINSKNLFHF